MKDATFEFNSIKGHGDAYAIDELTKYCIGSVNKINIHKYLTKKISIRRKNFENWTKIFVHF